MLRTMICMFWMVGSLVAAIAQKTPGTNTNPNKSATLQTTTTQKDTGKVVIKRQKTKITSQLDSVYKARVRMDKIDGVYIPRDLNECFKELDKLMEEEVKTKFKAFSEQEVDARTHASLGLWLTHKWSLADGSRLSAYFTKMQVPHPDYMVGVIIVSYHRYLNKKDTNPKDLVERFRKMWQVKQKAEAKKLLEENKKIEAENKKNKPK